MKHCPECSSAIFNKSKQWANQIYCNAQCRKHHHRKQKSQKTRFEQRKSNLLLNDEMRYVINQCRQAGTVQILTGHDKASFMETMQLIRERPPGKVHLCHVAPTKGDGIVGLLHHRNFFYGGDHQNNLFRNKYGSGGAYIKHSQLVDSWGVDANESSISILSKITLFLGDVLTSYIASSSIRKSKKYQLAKKILDLCTDQTIDSLMNLSFKELSKIWEGVSLQRLYKPTYQQESKFIAYMDSLSRFITYKDKNHKTLIELRSLMVIAYMALERVEASQTFNKYFYVKYEPLIKIKYGQAMLKDPNNWSVFKDFVYTAAFETLQGLPLNIKRFKRQLMSNLEFPPVAHFVKMPQWQSDLVYVQTF